MIDLPEISDIQLYRLKRVFDRKPDSDRLSAQDLAQLSKAFYSPIPKEDFNKLDGKEKEKYTMLNFYRPEFISEVSDSPWKGDVPDVKKSQYELLDLMKGKKLPVGTQRNWKGQDYIKHADGWVYAGGKHHGKLVGKTKKDPTHKDHADTHGKKKEEKKEKKPQSKTEHYKLVRKTEIIKEAYGNKVTFEGPSGKEYTADVYSTPLDGKVILKFPDVGYRNIPIDSMKNISVFEPGTVVNPVGELPKGKSLGWPPTGFVEPERKGNKTNSPKWYDQGNNAKSGRPSTKGKPSGKRTQYMSPAGSTCNLVGNVAFGKASVKAQAELNQKLQMTEVLLTDMGIKMKTPVDFMCQDMSSARTGVMAQFIPRQGYSNDKINLVKNLKTANKSLLHEIGHGIDYAMEQKGVAGSYFRGNPTLLKEELEELTQVLRESKFYEATGAKDAPGNVDDDFLEPDNRYAKYLKDQSEVFARAFEVYTYSHALDMVSEGKLPAEYTENIVPDFLRAGFASRMISNPDKVDETLDKVTSIMDRIFANRAIQKAIQEVDLAGYLRKSLDNKFKLSSFTLKELFIQAHDAKKLAASRKKAKDKEGYNYWVKKFEQIKSAINSGDIKKAKVANIGETRTHKDGSKWTKQGVGNWVLNKESLSPAQVIEEAKLEAAKDLGIKDAGIQLELRKKELELSLDIAVDKKFSGVNARRGAKETLMTSIRNVVGNGADPAETIGLVHMMADGEKIFDFDSFEKASRDSNDIVSILDFLPKDNEAAKLLAIDLADKIPAVSSRNVGKGEIMLAFMTADAGKGTKGDLEIKKPGEETQMYELKTSSGVVTPKSVKSKKTYIEANKILIDKMRAKGVADSDLPKRVEGGKKIHYDFSPERMSDLKTFPKAVEDGKMTKDEAKEMLTDFFADIRDVPRSKIEENMKRIDVMNMDADDLGKVLVDIDLDAYIAETGKLLILDLNNPDNPKAGIVTSAKDMLDMDAKGNARIHAFASGYGQGEKNTNTHGAGISVHLRTKKPSTRKPKEPKEPKEKKEKKERKPRAPKKAKRELTAIEKIMMKKSERLLEILKKNQLPIDDQGSSIETGNYSNDLQGTSNDPRMDAIKDALEDHMYGMDPVEIIIAPNTKLVAVKTDEGVYSGHVKRIKDGEEENILKIEKQTLPTLLQYLKAKELIEPEVAEKEEDSSTETVEHVYRIKLLDLLNKLL